MHLHVSIAGSIFFWVWTNWFEKCSEAGEKRLLAGEKKKLLADPPFRIPSWNQARVGTKTQKKTKKSSVIITIKCKNKNKNQIFFIHNTTFLQEILLSVWFQWPSHTSILVWMNVCIYVWCMHMHAYTPPSLLSLPPYCPWPRRTEKGFWVLSWLFPLDLLIVHPPLLSGRGSWDEGRWTTRGGGYGRINHMGSGWVGPPWREFSTRNCEHFGTPATKIHSKTLKILTPQNAGMLWFRLLAQKNVCICGMNLWDKKSEKSWDG